MADFFSYFRPKVKQPEQPVEEERSITYGGPVVSDWDSAFGYGKNVDKLSLVYGCTNLIASSIASLPIQLNRKLPKGHESAVDHPYYDLITKTPNPYQTNYTLWHWAVVQVLLFGNCYILKIRNGRGEVAELNPLNPNSVEIEIKEDGTLVYKMVMAKADGTSYMTEYTGDRLIHIKGYSRNGIFGVSIIENFKNLFDGYAEVETSGTQIAKNAAKPSGVVYHPGNIKEEELNKLKTGWLSGFTGKNSGKTAWLPNVFKIESIPAQLTAMEAEIVAGKTYTAQRIVCDIFGCPAHRFNLTNAPTYASVEENNRSFVTLTLAPIITNIEQQIQKQLLDDSEEIYINFNVNGLLRGDVAARVEFYRFMMEHGSMTPNQVHEAEETGIVIPPEQGGDTYLVPLNYGIATNKSATPVSGSA
jgi:HK97 family phage portal protein